jgi:lysylphosphatidylglycerol synthetase-like protein (DUF2156 family)
MKRIPFLNVFLALAGVILTIGTALAIGLANLGLSEAGGHYAPVVFAAGLTIAIMAVAYVLAARGERD